MGITEDGETLILMTCDGRGAGEAAGCRMATDVVDIMLEFNAYQAMKPDSGGSTTFYFQGEVFNHVSENASTAPTERRVVDSLLVHSVRVDPGCGVRLSGDAVTIDDGSFCFVRSGPYRWAEPAGENGLSRYTYASWAVRATALRGGASGSTRPGCIEWKPASRITGR